MWISFSPKVPDLADHAHFVPERPDLDQTELVERRLLASVAMSTRPASLGT